MQRQPNPAPREVLPSGTRIEVRDRFCASWSSGFEVAETMHDGYLVRRMSDHYLLPGHFIDHEVRLAS